MTEVEVVYRCGHVCREFWHKKTKSELKACGNRVCDACSLKDKEVANDNRNHSEYADW